MTRGTTEWRDPLTEWRDPLTAWRGPGWASNMHVRVGKQGTRFAVTIRHHRLLRAAS